MVSLVRKTNGGPAAETQLTPKLSRVTVQLNIFRGCASLRHGREQCDYRSAQSARRTFPAIAHSTQSPVSDRIARDRRGDRRRIAQKRDHRTDQPTRQRRELRSCFTLFCRTRSATAIFSPWSMDGIHSIPNRRWATRACATCFGFVARKRSTQSKPPISFCATGIFRWSCSILS